MGLACEYNQLSTLFAARDISSEEQGKVAVLAGCIICFARKILKNLETIQNHVLMAEIAIGKVYKTFCPPQVAAPESENVWVSWGLLTLFFLVHFPRGFTKDCGQGVSPATINITPTYFS